MMTGAAIRMNLKSYACLVVAIFAVFAAANVLAFPSGPVEFKYAGLAPNSQVVSIHIPGNAPGAYTSVYAGPYGISVQGDPFKYYMMCFNAAATAPTTYQNALATNTTGAYAYFDPFKINMVAYLASQLEIGSSMTAAMMQKNASINLAMWEVLADGAITASTSSLNDAKLDVTFGDATAGTFYVSGDASGINYWLQLALNNKGIATPADFLIPLTCSAEGKCGYNTSVQPFVTMPVPEPATLLLLGSGIVGLGLVRRRKRRGVE